MTPSQTSFDRISVSTAAPSEPQSMTPLQTEATQLTSRTTQQIILPSTSIYKTPSQTFSSSSGSESRQTTSETSSTRVSVSTATPSEPHSMTLLETRSTVSTLMTASTKQTISSSASTYKATLQASFSPNVSEYRSTPSQSFSSSSVSESKMTSSETSESRQTTLEASSTRALISTTIPSEPQSMTNLESRSTSPTLEIETTTKIIHPLPSTHDRPSQTSSSPSVSESRGTTLETSSTRASISTATPSKPQSITLVQTEFTRPTLMTISTKQTIRPSASPYETPPQASSSPSVSESKETSSETSSDRISLSTATPSKTHVMTPLQTEATQLTSETRTTQQIILPSASTYETPPQTSSSSSASNSRQTKSETSSTNVSISTGTQSEPQRTTNLQSRSTQPTLETITTKQTIRTSASTYETFSQTSSSPRVSESSIITKTLSARVSISKATPSEPQSITPLQSGTTRPTLRTVTTQQIISPSTSTYETTSETSSSRVSFSTVTSSKPQSMTPLQTRSTLASTYATPGITETENATMQSTQVQTTLPPHGANTSFSIPAQQSTPTHQLTTHISPNTTTESGLISPTESPPSHTDKIETGATIVNMTTSTISSETVTTSALSSVSVKSTPLQEATSTQLGSTSSLSTSGVSTTSLATSEETILSSRTSTSQLTSPSSNPSFTTKPTSETVSTMLTTKISLSISEEQQTTTKPTSTLQTSVQTNKTQMTSQSSTTHQLEMSTNKTSATSQTPLPKPTSSLIRSSTSTQTSRTYNLTSTTSTTTIKKNITSATNSTISTTTTVKTSTTKCSTLKPCVSDEKQNCSYVNGVCTCTCTNLYVGNQCEYGKNHTSASLNAEKAPKRNVYVIITLQKNFTKALSDPTSNEFKILSDALFSILQSIFLRAGPDYFVDMKITGFSSGSVIVNSEATYAYPNNQTGIDILNNNLLNAVDSSLVTSLKNITQAVNAEAFVRNITLSPINITNVSQLSKYVTCALSYSNYTATCDNETCFCTGPCFNIPGYCNYNGICYNAINGPICQCYKNAFYQYKGIQCETYERNSGFYGLIFAIIIAVLLLLIVFIFAVIMYRKKRMFVWTAERRDSKTWFTYDEERSNFQYTDMDALAKLGITKGTSKAQKYGIENPYENLSSATYVPKLESVDTTHSFKIKRPEVLGRRTGHP